MNPPREPGDSEPEQLSLSQSARFLLEECRMVLPGIQALLGFQLIAVFSSEFDKKLDAVDQRIHLVATFLVALAIILVMTPAAYSRQAHPREVTEGFIRASTRLLLVGMFPLAVGTCLEFYLIAHAILHTALGAVLASVLFAMFVLFWIVLPRSKALRHFVAGRR
jgi:hypothetical protein